MREESVLVANKKSESPNGSHTDKGSHPQPPKSEQTRTSHEFRGDTCRAPLIQRTTRDFVVLF
jgi:hypothetical protein